MITLNIKRKDSKPTAEQYVRDHYQTLQTIGDQAVTDILTNSTLPTKMRFSMKLRKVEEAGMAEKIMTKEAEVAAAEDRIINQRIASGETVNSTLKSSDIARKAIKFVKKSYKTITDTQIERIERKIEQKTVHTFKPQYHEKLNQYNEEYTTKILYQTSYDEIAQLHTDLQSASFVNFESNRLKDVFNQIKTTYEFEKGIKPKITLIESKITELESRYEKGLDISEQCNSLIDQIDPLLKMVEPVSLYNETVSIQNLKETVMKISQKPTLNKSTIDILNHYTTAVIYNVLDIGSNDSYIYQKRNELLENLSCIVENEVYRRTPITSSSPSTVDTTNEEDSPEKAPPTEKEIADAKFKAFCETLGIQT